MFLTFIISIIGIILTLLLVIGVHEFAHFSVARLVGVKVLRFSIGFGKALFRWHDKKGTEYVIASIPLGGYVKMVDENEESVRPEDLPFAYNRQSIWKRVLIIAAGPISNLFFAFFLYWLLLVVGFVTVVPIIGSVKPDSIAQNAGLKPQQEIIRVDDRFTPDWVNIVIQLMSRAGDTNPIKLLVSNSNASTPVSYSLNIAKWYLDPLKPDPLDSIGIVPYEPTIPAQIGTIIPNSPAAQSHLQSGDRIIAVNKQKISDWMALINLVSSHPENTFNFTLIRQGKTIIQPVTVGYKRDIFFKKHGFLGITPQFEWPKNLLRKNQYGPIAAISHAWDETNNYIHLNFLILGKMLSGKLSFKSLGGPITIFESAGTALNHGIIAFFSFVAFLSISIGIINILPIPGLDGGHLLFQCIEAITRKPLSLRIQVLFLRLGIVLLLLIFTQALINDLLRL